MEKDKTYGTDFWWLSSIEAKRYGYIDLFHQEPYSDEPNSDKDPLSCPMLKGNRRYPLEFVGQWKAKFRNVNVFRSYALYSTDIKNNQIIGPFILDIDRSVEFNGGYRSDFNRALTDTWLIVKEHCSNFKDKDYRVLFTGHKGFHIEIRPQALGTSTHVDQNKHFENLRMIVNKQFGDNFVDRFHPHVRLHNSINSWADYSGHRIDSMDFEVTTDELFDLNAEDIFKKGKNLASLT